MKDVSAILQRSIKIDRDQIYKVVFADREIQDFIIESITDDQLFTKGEDGDGISLGEYTPFSKELKRLKGLPTDRITLFDEGDFYKSFSIILHNGFIEVFADSEKEDTDLVQEFGLSILKLNEENTNELIQLMLPKIREVSLAFIQKGILPVVR